VIRYGPPSAEVLVLVRREGLLSAVGHDVALRVARFEIEVDGDPPTAAVRARFDPSSLEVVSAIRGDREVPGLSAADRQQIERNVHEVLRPDLHPEITFSAVAGPDAATGEVTVHGVTRRLAVPWRTEGSRRVAEVPLDQRDFGIPPFRALMGTLKVKPLVLVRVRLPVRETVR
jgi:YceI-like domain